MTSITTQVTFCSASMSANRKIADDMADQVVTVVDVFLRPRPATRTHTFASLFEMSIPAQRACTSCEVRQ